MLQTLKIRQGAKSTVKTFMRLMPVLVACVASQAFASNDPPATPAPSESAKPSSPAATPAAATTPTATTDTPAAATPAPAPATGQRLVLEDKTLTNTEVQRLLSQGYKPQKGRNDTVLYCRTEAQMGTHFEKKVCMSADQIKQATVDSSDLTRKFQQNLGSSGK
jgi:hypothetical protein